SVTTTTDTTNFPISDQSGTTVTLTFTATDTCGGTVQGTMPIIVQNMKPTLTGLTPGVTTPETVDAERQIATYTCSDPSDNVTPTITVSPSTSPEYFVTRFWTGTSTNGVYEIILPTQSASWQFNYDTVNSYTIVVKCLDGKPSGTASATLVVSLSPNQPPEITNLPLGAKIGVSQTTSNGEVIYTILYTDPDPDDTVDFTFTCNPTGCPLTVLASGEVQLTDNMSNANANGYDVKITPTDNRNNVGSARTLTVVVTANTPIFGTTTYTSGSSMILDTTSGSVSIGTVTFTNADCANTTSITMNSNSYFTFVDNRDGTGSVTTTTDTTNFPISDQSGTTVTLTFTATDTCGGTAQGTMPIIVQNIKPTLTGLTPGLTTSETVDAERRIATYTCSDPSDNVIPTMTVSPSTSPEYFVTRFLSGTSTNGVYEIILPSQSASWQFNYDTVKSYTIVVKCLDGKPSGTASTTLVVSLSPNQPPEITNLPLGATIGVSQTTSSGEVIYTIQYTDLDPDDTVNFTFTCNPPGCPLTVLASGEVQLTDNISNANANGYDVKIRPTDNKNNVGSARTLTVVVTVGSSGSGTEGGSGGSGTGSDFSIGGMPWLIPSVVSLVLFVVNLIMFLCVYNKLKMQIRTNKVGPI
ncbi:hypothetical protein DPMN_027895, partial [Dreissena polymorpha]